MGFCTVGSCEGHLDRATGGPYIMLSSLDGDELERQWINRVDQSAEYLAVRKRIIVLNLNARAALERLLAHFYNARPVPYDQMLVTQGYGPGATRLKCMGVEIRELAPAKDHQAALWRYQQEFRNFAKFLEKYIS
jgi:hypothetical protein